MSSHVAPTAAAARKPSAVRAIVFGGAIAGALDIAFAFIYYGQRFGSTPQGVLKGVASGLFGPAARSGGWGMAMLGLGLHFAIALGAAATFYAVSRRVPVLTRHAVPVGMAFGFAAYLVMNGVVLPLSAFPNAPFPPRFTANTLPVILAHLFLVGLPIALCVRRWGR